LFVNFFKVLIIIVSVKILIVSAETPIFTLLDTKDHGIDGKVGNTGASLSNCSHLFLLCGCESSFTFLRVKEESRTSVS